MWKIKKNKHVNKQKSFVNYQILEWIVMPCQLNVLTGKAHPIKIL